MFSALRDSLSSLIYPQACAVCGASVDDLGDGFSCDKCWRSTRFFSSGDLLCDKCGAYAGESMPGGTAVRCQRCTEHDYGRARAIGVYEKALGATVLNLKHHPFIPKRLRPIVLDAVEHYGFSDSTSIVPVPLSKLRRFERGFNQAEVIAEFISSQTGIALNTTSLIRSKNTPMHRVGMDQRARELTVVGAFEVAAPRLVEGERILLVDDLFTSGSTASACARVLKKKGASEMNVFTLARAVERIRR